MMQQEGQGQRWLCVTDHGSTVQVAFVSLMEIHLSVFLHVQVESLTTVAKYRQRRHRIVVIVSKILLMVLPFLILDFLIPDLEMISKSNTWLIG